ncbi:hypothetical protein GOP47_0011352 [Adiantum capillus-veneris]|uniref:Sugar transporter SWEET1 n=1 Tax=Adiantum capillus-veneris TaxID=13818 RepID=A0A9D4USM1_ADICA|nr:hypothetical protein GOP47_0011352 [Adiantum capillus-veneris]
MGVAGSDGLPPPPPLAMSHILTLASGIAGNVVGVLLYASPMPIFVRICRRRSTEEFSGVPYAFSALSTAQWTYFAILKGPRERPLASLTAIGFCLQFAFNYIYLRFATKSQRVLQTALLAIVASFYACMVTLTHIFLKADVRINVVGISCVVNSIFFCASPLVILKRVIQSGSTEFLPFYLPLFMFLTGAIWSIFSYLTHDFYIGIPNGAGAILGGLQILIHVYYKVRDYYRHRKGKVLGSPDFCNKLEEGREACVKEEGKEACINGSDDVKFEKRRFDGGDSENCALSRTSNSNLASNTTKQLSCNYLEEGREACVKEELKEACVNKNVETNLDKKRVVDEDDCENCASSSTIISSSTRSSSNSAPNTRDELNQLTCTPIQ